VDAFAPGLVVNNANGSLEQGLQILDAAIAEIRTAERQPTIQDDPQSLDFLDRFPSFVSGCLSLAHAAFEQLERQGERVQRIADFVSDAGYDPTEGREAILATQSGLQGSAGDGHTVDGLGHFVKFAADRRQSVVEVALQPSETGI
jgi:hypothetical protein